MFLDKNFLKRVAGFQKWTFLKMSKIQNPKILLKKDPKNWVCEHNAHIHIKNNFKLVIIIFFIFLKKKDLELFYYPNIGTNG